MTTSEPLSDDRQVKSTAELTDAEMAMIRQARVPAEHDYEYVEDDGLSQCRPPAVGPSGSR